MSANGPDGRFYVVLKALVVAEREQVRVGPAGEKRPLHFVITLSTILLLSKLSPIIFTVSF